jgi:L-ascorbate metabolism protein UlaG (beta-lactamase superfamily)
VHHDHLNTTSIKRVEQLFQPIYFGGQGIRQWLNKVGVHNRRIIELQWWESIHMYPFSGGTKMRLTFVPAIHWSMRRPYDLNKTLWGGFFVQNLATKTSYYFAGDTAFCSPLIEELKERCPVPTVCALPIGAYQPRWYNSWQHMDPMQAVEMHKMLKAGTSIAVHHGTFLLADEPFWEPAELLNRARAAAGLSYASFQVLRHGETLRMSLMGDFA